MESGCPRMHRVSAGGGGARTWTYNGTREDNVFLNGGVESQGHAPFRFDHSVNEVLMDGQVNENN